MAIRIARVLCIIGLVYSHGWTGLTGHELQLSLNNPQSVFRIILVELFGRSSVPLLSAISGYLVVASAGKRDYGGFVSAKARAILAPMILWNALAILLVSGSAWLFSLPAPQPIDTLWFADELLSLTRANDINVQMPFLRDLFLCMLAAPLLVHAPNRWLVLLAAITFAWTASEWSTPIFQRPPILLFFLIGMLVRRQGLAPMLAGLSPWLIWPAFVMLAGLKITVLLGHAPFTDMLTAPRVDLALRLAGALATWQLVWRLADSRWAPAFCRLEPYMFLHVAGWPDDRQADRDDGGAALSAIPDPSTGAGAGHRADPCRRAQTASGAGRRPAFRRPAPALAPGDHRPLGMQRDAG